MQVLAGVNTYTGNTSITAGTLQIAAAGSLGSGNYAGAISNSGALVLATSSSQIFSGAITGSGSLTQLGPNTLTLSNAGNSYSGPTNVFGRHSLPLRRDAAAQYRPDCQRGHLEPGRRRRPQHAGRRLETQRRREPDHGLGRPNYDDRHRHGRRQRLPGSSQQRSHLRQRVHGACGGGRTGRRELLPHQQLQLYRGARRLVRQASPSRPRRPRPGHGLLVRRAGGRPPGRHGRLHGYAQQLVHGSKLRRHGPGARRIDQRRFFRRRRYAAAQRCAGREHVRQQPDLQRYQHGHDQCRRQRADARGLGQRRDQRHAERDDQRPHRHHPLAELVRRQWQDAHAGRPDFRCEYDHSVRPGHDLLRRHGRQFRLQPGGRTRARRC